MGNLIKALQIFLKYGNSNYPTHCEHDEMWICGDEYTKDNISEEDVAELDRLGFFWDEEDEGFKSFKFGSA